MRALVIKSTVFTLVTVLATMMLAATIRNSSGGSTKDYSALFADATSLNTGDDVRMAGVKIGSVGSIDVADNRLAGVKFSVDSSIDIPRGTVAELRFRNLVGETNFGEK